MDASNLSEERFFHLGSLSFNDIFKISIPIFISTKKHESPINFTLCYFSQNSVCLKVKAPIDALRSLPGHDWLPFTRARARSHSATDRFKKHGASPKLWASSGGLSSKAVN